MTPAETAPPLDRELRRAESENRASIEDAATRKPADARVGADGNSDTGPSAKATMRSFNARRLADELADETSVAIDAGGRVLVYRDGHYRPGESDLRARIASRLGDEWRRNRADEVLAYLRDASPGMWPEPPRGQVNLANGILDIRTQTLGPHDPGFRSPLQIPVAYDPDATCPAIERFLGEILAPELVPVIYELAGYLLTPDQSLQVAFMLLGGGAAGKSTLLRLLTALIGKQNVSSVALHRLDEDRFAPAELQGKLANIFADLDARSLQASSIFKAITGGDAITAERKYAPPFSFRPYARLIYSANEPPPTPDSSQAFFRRWLILPFENRFDAASADRRIIERLTTPEELSGLLNRALDALPGLLARGAFTRTSAGTAAADRFRVDADSVAGFVADACELDPDARTPKPKMFPAYRAWCVDNNRKPLSKQRFNRHLEALNPALTITTIQGTEHWSGLGLRAV